MELRARFPSALRSAALLAALAALAAPATAGAAAKPKQVKAPVVTRIAPLDVAVGEKLTIRGRHFIRGRGRNTVVFKRSGARAVFAKADIATKKMLTLKVPSSLQEFFATSEGRPLPTRFRVRVLARTLGKKFTALNRSPLVSGPRAQPPGAGGPGGPPAPPATPDGDCDGDGTRNGADDDDDNDGLTDGIEASLSLNPCLSDSDEDGELDLWEFDCDRDRILNRDQPDDDRDLLDDGAETQIGSDPCLADTDGDGVEDGYEWRSAMDLNDDEYQQPNTFIAYPHAMPYPNPGFADGDVDHDGDTLTLAEEFALWIYTYSVTKTDTRSLDALSYSDGEQYSRFRRVVGGVHDGRRVPTLAADGYDKDAQFVAWATGAGYRNVWLHDPVGAPASFFWDANVMALEEFALFDVDRSGAEDAAERRHYDFDGDSWLSDDERDEDADGLTNYDEAHGRMLPSYWSGCYSFELPYKLAYGGVRLDNADTDGDGIRDGADDQDHDDIPNVMELSRIAASGLNDLKGNAICRPADNLPAEYHHAHRYGRVNPFNPCLPYRGSRTCPVAVDGGTGAPFDGSPDWYALN